MAMYYKMSFYPNKRKNQLDAHERICRENKWIEKKDPFIKPNTKPYVIMRGSELIGYFCLDFVGNNQVLFWGFHILPKYRGKGEGTECVLRMLYALSHDNSFNGEKVNAVFCYVEPNNEVAKHIYLKYGYVYGEDERLYNDFVSCKYPHINKVTGEYTIVFMQRVWGESGFTMKQALEDEFAKIKEKTIKK